MGAEAAAQKQPASVRTLRQSVNTYFVRAIKLSPNQKKEKNDRKIGKGSWTGAHNAPGYKEKK